MEEMPVKVNWEEGNIVTLEVEEEQGNEAKNLYYKYFIQIMEILRDGGIMLVNVII